MYIVPIISWYFIKVNTFIQGVGLVTNDWPLKRFYYLLDFCSSAAYGS